MCGEEEPCRAGQIGAFPGGPSSALATFPLLGEMASGCTGTKVTWEVLLGFNTKV